MRPAGRRTKTPACRTAEDPTRDARRLASPWRFRTATALLLYRAIAAPMSLAVELKQTRVLWPLLHDRSADSASHSPLPSRADSSASVDAPVASLRRHRAARRR